MSEVKRRKNPKRFRVKLRGYYYTEYICTCEESEKALCSARYKFAHDPENPVNHNNLDKDWFKIEEVPDEY